MDALIARHRELLKGDRASTLEDGLVDDFRDNLLPHLTDEDERWIREAFEQGDGHELAPRPGRPPRAHASYSSATLAANTFAPFRERADALTFTGLGGFEGVRLEAKHHPLPERLEQGGVLKEVANRREANLDAELTGPGVLVGVESKLTEHLRAEEPEALSGHYRRTATLAPLPEQWRAAIRRRMGGSSTAAFLDAAQLLKHGLALSRAAADGAFGPWPVDVHLVYVYWRPSNAEDFEELEAHRAEVDAFAEEVAGEGLTFHAITHQQLWDAWRGDDRSPAWLVHHANAVEQRYGVEI
ncbi:unannotated protein [freshwater metagenome]|uniref:Unannotated protein n=1 Tax=freshwater metagenome TaxID=449393 RepID=A0A6J7K0V2_9ZZZZ